MTFGLIKSGRQLFYRDRLYGQSPGYRNVVEEASVQGRAARANQDRKCHNPEENAGEEPDKEDDWAEGRRWLEDALQRDIRTRANDRRAAKVLRGAAALATAVGDYGPAEAWLEQYVALSEAIEDAGEIAAGCLDLAHIAIHRQEYDRASALLERALVIDRRLGNRRGIAMCMMNLAAVTRFQGHVDRAHALLQEAIPLCRELGDTFSLAIALENLGIVAVMQGDHARAHASLDESLAAYQAVEAPFGVIDCIEAFMFLASARGDFLRAVYTAT